VCDPPARATDEPIDFGAKRARYGQ
jgi:hypothetical protein